MSDYPVFCDRSDYFRSVAKTFDINTRYCTLHITRNLLRNNRFTHAHKNFIWELQECKWEALYEGQLVLLGKDCGKEVEEIVRAIPPERWILYTAIGQTPLYGWRSTNFVESVNATTLVNKLREKAPFEFLDGVLESMANALYKRQCNSANWLKAKREVTPGAEELYEEQLREMGNYKVVVTIKDKQASVSRVGRLPPFRRTVDLEG
ncbi:hypothetical protein PF005_g32346, partial [Phytophthora fragariae]